MSKNVQHAINIFFLGKPDTEHLYGYGWYCNITLLFPIQAYAQQAHLCFPKVFPLVSSFGVLISDCLLRHKNALHFAQKGFPPEVHER